MDIKSNWITGFVDGRGCFFIEKTESIIKHTFIVSQDEKSVDTLYALKKKFKCGSVYKAGKNMMAFKVSNKKSLETIIIPFFKKHPLQTEKRKDFYKFVESITSCNDFYDKQNENFIFSISDEWFAGFIDAEGCFYVSIVNNFPTLQLLINAGEKEKALFFFLQKFLSCGKIVVSKDKFLVFKITSSKDFITKIFPKLYTKTGKNLLKSIKRVFFQKFRKIVLLIEKKQHLTFLGMEKIVKLKLDMNKVE